jgi:hypothetical protein
MEDARRSFTAARARAADSGRSTAEAELALIAFDWRSERLPDCDERLAEVLAALDEQARGTPPDAEGRLLRAHAALLHVVSLLYVWLTHLPANGGLPPNGQQELRARVRRALAYDSQLGDVRLVGGLIDYYFAQTEIARQGAVRELIEGTATSRGILLPEALDLIDRERRIEAADADALNRYLALLKAYLVHDDVPVAVREDLRRRLERLSAYKDIGAVETSAYEHESEPSIEDVRHRGDVLRRRVGMIVQPRLRHGGDAAEQMEGLLARLDGATRALATDVSELQQAEHAVMLRAAQFLLPEDDDAN